MTTLNPPTVWAIPERARRTYAHARAVPAGRTLFVSGQFGVAPDGRMRAGFPDQIGQAMDNVEAVLAAHGMAPADVTRALFVLTRAEDLPALGLARRARWASDAPAAVTVLVASALARPDALVAVEVTAVRRPARFGGAAAGVLGRVAGWARVAAHRPESADHLDDRMLRDIGLDRYDVASGARQADERRRRLPIP